MKIPDSERQKFENLITAQANKYGMKIEDYLKKVWYHEEAVKLGEYVAGSLVNELSVIVPKEKIENNM